MLKYLSMCGMPGIMHTHYSGYLCTMSNIHNLRSAVLDYIAEVAYYQTEQPSRIYNMMHSYELYDELRGRDITMYMLVPYNYNTPKVKIFPPTSQIFKHTRIYSYYMCNKAGHKLYANV